MKATADRKITKNGGHVNMNGNTKWVMWILGILITIFGALSGYAVNRVDSVQQSLRIEYVQKVDYRADIGEMKESLKCINDKMDRILQNGNRK
jgi:hypothetical protein